MPVIQAEVSVAAGALNSNLFAGSAFENSPRRAAVSIGCTAAATGTFITLNTGAEVLLEESAPFVLTTFPIIPDHMYYNDIVEAVERLRLSARNPTGGAVVHRALALVTYA